MPCQGILHKECHTIFVCGVWKKVLPLLQADPCLPSAQLAQMGFAVWLFASCPPARFPSHHIFPVPWLYDLFHNKLQSRTDSIQGFWGHRDWPQKTSPSPFIPLPFRPCLSRHHLSQFTLGFIAQLFLTAHDFGLPLAAAVQTVGTCCWPLHERKVLPLIYTHKINK